MNIYVISCERNAGSFIKKSINSVRKQTIKPNKHYFIDDASDVLTRDILTKYTLNNPCNATELILNDIRKSRLGNIVETINQINDPEGIVITVDGDDWLSCTKSIEYVANRYKQNNNLEFFYSNFMFSHNSKLGISKKIPNDNWDPYNSPWMTSHLITFKIKAFNRINYKNFLDENGNYFKMASDHATILPLIHCIKKEYGTFKGFIEFSPLPLYVYQFNENNSYIRNSFEGNKDAKTAANCAEFIKKRGYVE